MNAETAQILCEMNTVFYREQADSFSATRQSPWTGWQQCLEVVKGQIGDSACLSADNLLDNQSANLSDEQDDRSSTNAGGGQAERRISCLDKSLSDGSSECRVLSVFDLACGNLRLESFFAAGLSPVECLFFAVDNCDDLVPEVPHVDYQSLDILDVVLCGQRLSDRIEAPPCDISVSFGFMHHIPSSALREEILASLVLQTRPGGLVIVSFWQFLNNATLRGKAQITTAIARAERGLPELEAGDYVLGWKDIPGAYRYCHSFSEAEIGQLAESVADVAIVVSRFIADGRTNNLNTYLIFKVL